MLSRRSLCGLGQRGQGSAQRSGADARTPPHPPFRAPLCICCSSPLALAHVPAPSSSSSPSSVAPHRARRYCRRGCAAQVKIKRWIALKKDLYYVDGKETSRSEVVSLLETCGLSRSNQLNIVPQFKVTSIMDASEKQWLNTLKDVAGVSTYDDRKAESLRTLADSEDNMQRCKEQMTTIEKKLAGLAAEKDELEAYTRLDRRRKVAEYTYYHTELKRAKSEIASSDSKRAQSSEMAFRSATDDEELTSTIKEHERQLRVLGESLKSAVAETKARAAEHKKQLEHTARLDADHKAEEVAHTKREEQKREKEAELEQVDASIADVEQELGEQEPQAEQLQNAAAAAAREVERIEAVLQQLHSKEAGGQRFSSKKERDKHLAKEAELLRAAIDKKSEQAKSLEKELDAAEDQRQQSEEHEAERRSKADERRKRVADAQDKCARWRTEYAELTDQRKQLWRRDADVRKERKAIEEELAKAERTLAHSMSRTQWEAIDACKRIVREKQIKGVHGLLLELIKCDGKFNTAVDVAAGNQLFHMVVDSDDIAAKLVEELKQASAGRVTFMPLNRLRVEPEPDPGEGVMPFVPKGRATLGLKWKNKGEGVPKDGVEFENAPLTAALEKQLKSANPKHDFTEAELRALGVAEGRLSLDSYVKAAGPGGKVFYFKPVYMVLQFEERFRPAVSHVFHKTVLVQTLQSGAAKSREHDVDCITLDGDQVNRKGSMSGGWLEARKSRMGAQADLAQLRGRLKALDASLTQLERDKEQHEARALETQGELDKHTVAHKKLLREADLEAELEAIDTGTTGGGGTGRGGAGSSSSGITGGGGGTSRDAHKAANAQKRSAHKALQAAIESDQERLRAVQQELKANFESDGKLTEAERRELTEKQEQLREKRKERDAAASAAARAHAGVSSLRASLSEDLRKRQDELKEALERITDADAAGGEWQPGGAAAEELRVSKERLAAAAEALDASRKLADEQRARAEASQKRLDEMRSKAADAAKVRADAAKQVDMLLQKKALLQQKAEEFEQHIRKLGTLPQQAYAATGAHTSMSSKQLQAEIQQCAKELNALNEKGINKKALDQYTAFADEREKLSSKYHELEKGKVAIERLIRHLDNMKDAAIERTFKGVAKNFKEVYRQLIGGEGSLIMVHSELLPANADAAAKVQHYVGVKIKVSFPKKGDATSMKQLSGGQKTMVALCFIFAIQKCDPAPFYIFDEIDANLDATYRAALAKMIQQQAHATDDKGHEAPTQFVTTTFQQDQIRTADKHFGVTHAAKMSTIKEIDRDEALRIIASEDRREQHAGGAGMGIAVARN